MKWIIILLYIILCSCFVLGENCSSFAIETNDEVFSYGEKISFSFSNFTTGDSVTYWIEDLSGKIVKSEKTTSNNNKKSYTVKEYSHDTALRIIAQRERNNCSLQRNEKLIVVQGEKQTLEDSLDILSHDIWKITGEEIGVTFSLEKSSEKKEEVVMELRKRGEKEVEESISISGSGEFEIATHLMSPTLFRCGEGSEWYSLVVSYQDVQDEGRVEIGREHCIEEIVEEEEEVITSFYIRSEKWKKEVTLYGRSSKETHSILLGNNDFIEKNVSGSFSFIVEPTIGNNTYVLVDGEGGVHTLDFFLEGETVEEEKVIEKEETELSGSYTFTPTGSVLYENEEEEEGKNTLFFFGGVAFLGIIGLWGQKRGIFKKEKGVLSQQNGKQKTKSRRLEQKGHQTYD